MSNVASEIYNAAKKLNLPPRIVLAQAILESAAFKKAPFNNFFGIKATQKDIAQGKYFETQTKEVINGQIITIKSKFTKFRTPTEAVERYNEIIKRNFPQADKNRHNEMLFLKGLFSGKYKYATDPNYIQKIKKIIQKLNDYVAKNKLKTAAISVTGAALLGITFAVFKKMQKDFEIKN